MYIYIYIDLYLFLSIPKPTGLCISMGKPTGLCISISYTYRTMSYLFLKLTWVPMYNYIYRDLNLVLSIPKTNMGTYV